MDALYCFRDTCGVIDGKAAVRLQPFRIGCVFASRQIKVLKDIGSFTAVENRFSQHIPPLKRV